MSGSRRDRAKTAAGTLPPIFTFEEAIKAGIGRSMVYRLRDEGFLEQIGHGRFRITGTDLPPDFELLEIADRAPRATICLTSALLRHDLTDEVPPEIDIAVPRGQWRPETDAPVNWHLFAPSTFDVGRTETRLDDRTTIGLYGPERSIIDVFRMSHLEGPELGVAALKRWLRRPGASPAELLTVARHFPKAYPKLRTTMEILL